MTATLPMTLACANGNVADFSPHEITRALRARPTQTGGM